MFSSSILQSSDHGSNLPGLASDASNIIFLHCLYDSANHNFDPTRIFYDYIDWISRTLETISRDDQPWIVRSHPHSVCHGEDSYQLLCGFPTIRKLFKSDNIFFQYGHLVSLRPLNSFLKIVTYSGSVAEEAILFHRRPITIAHTFISQLFPALCFKPSSVRDYEKLLLSGRSDVFCLQADSVLPFESYLKKIGEIVPPELQFSILNGSIQYSDALDPSDVQDYLDLMSAVQNG